MKNKVILLDRDGVLVQDRIDYIQTREQIQVYPRSIVAVDILREMGYTIFVVTNQSAVAKGIMTHEQVQEINWSINAYFGHAIEEFFYCPHHPDWFEGIYREDWDKFENIYRDDWDNATPGVLNKVAPCDCRKPLPGLIHHAQKNMYFDPEEVYMVGDSLRDVGAAKAAGCIPVFVKTTSRTVKDANFPETDVLVYDDLLAFSRGEITNV